MTTAIGATRAENPLALTVGGATEGRHRQRSIDTTRTPGVNATPIIIPIAPHLPDVNATPKHQINETPRRQQRKRRKPHRRKCQGCKEKFDPKRDGQIYCTDACRKKDWRKKQKWRKRAGKAAAKPTPPETRLDSKWCPYCKTQFWIEPGSKKKYCKPSHKVKACDARRTAAITAFQHALNLTPAAAEQIGRKLTLADMAKKLHQWGYTYDEFARTWVQPVEIVVEGEVIQ
jgi:hypothetical protein